MLLGFDYQNNVFPDYYDIEKLDIDSFLKEKFKLREIKKYSKKLKIRNGVKPQSCKFYNLAISFDIETSSFYKNEEKMACTYLWGLCIEGYTIVGRTWVQAIELFTKITDYFNCNINKYIICYIHNLSYEFQFMKNYFNFYQVFGMKSRTPLYGRTMNGIEFRCSYLLTNSNLDSVGKNLIKYKGAVKKLTGAFDYNLIRHSKTELEPEVYEYQANDVRVVVAMIDEKREKEKKGVLSIPYTSTGYVRRYVKEHTIECDKDGSYKRMIHRLTIDGETEYELLQRAFAGGFTHSNPFRDFETLENVRSFDFTSAYPSIMCFERFPMSKGKKVVITDNKHIINYLKKYCCLFNVEFTNIKSKFPYDNYISESKLFLCTGKKRFSNGRLVEAEKCALTVTELDFNIICKTYTFEKMKIGKFYIYEKGYLPKQIIDCVLKFYNDKTKLKDVEGEEENYSLSKALLNSIYGMMVTNFLKNSFKYDNVVGWYESAEKTKEELIRDYNKDKNRFLFYPWGVWITAYCRYNLWSSIFELKNDYVYSDTDSAKFLNYEAHSDYFENYNRNIDRKIKLVSEHYGYNENVFSPINIKGKICTLGYWDDEGYYQKFKTLGAKRYMYLKKDELNITVSGLNKKVCVPYILEKCKNDGIDPFEMFSDGMVVPAEFTGKLTHSYFDKEIYGEVTDYKGVTYTFHEMSYVHLEPSPYILSINEYFIEYVMSILC